MPWHEKETLCSRAGVVRQTFAPVLITWFNRFQIASPTFLCCRKGVPWPENTVQQSRSDQADICPCADHLVEPISDSGSYFLVLQKRYALA